MKIKMSVLRKLCVMHFKRFEDCGCESVDIQRDFYWTIPLEDLYNPNADLAEFGLGSLIQEWEDMELIMKGEYVPSPVSLQWLAGLFLAVAEQLLNPTNEPTE